MSLLDSSLLRGEPAGTDPLDVADWLEALALVGPAWRVNEVNTREQLENLYLLDSFSSSVSGALLAMKRRARSLGELYPFRDLPGGLRRVQSEASQSYEALLWLSLVDLERDPSLAPRVGSAFEQCCEVLMTRVPAEDVNLVHFGWPSRSGRPERFPDAVRWLASRLSVTMGAGYRDPRRNDGGVDLVSWRQLFDGTTYEYRLVQCTVGRELLAKSREVDVELWMTWLAFQERPKVTLTVPYEVAKRNVYARQVGELGTLVLDRMRLLQLGGGAASGVDLFARISSVSGVDAP